MIEWEDINSNSDRLKVPGGWIVRSCVKSGSYDGGASVHQIFISDSKHIWNLNEKAIKVNNHIFNRSCRVT